MGRRLLAAVVLAAALAGPGCSADKACDTLQASDYDPQAWPHPTARAAVDEFLRSELARTSGVSGRFELERTLPPAPGETTEVAVFGEVDGPGELTVQHGGPGWAVSGYRTCPKD